MIYRRLLAAAAAAVFLAGCANGAGTEAAEAKPTTITATRQATSTITSTPTTRITTDRAPSGPPYPDHAECSPASDEYVSAINDAFADSSQTLMDAVQVEDSNDVTIISANIYRGDDYLSSADLWAARHGVIYALSGDARRRTLLPDGRDTLNFDFSDEKTIAATDCTGNARWARINPDQADEPAAEVEDAAPAVEPEPLLQEPVEQEPYVLYCIEPGFPGPAKMSDGSIRVVDQCRKPGATDTRPAVGAKCGDPNGTSTDAQGRAVYCNPAMNEPSLLVWQLQP